MLRLAAVLVPLLALAAAAPLAAADDPVTPTLGSGDGRVSRCATASYVVGLDAELDARGHIVGITALCRPAGGGPETRARRFGAQGRTVERGASRCPGDRVLATGLAGRAGDVLDAVAVACPGPDGAPVGGTGGARRTGLVCQPGRRLAGLRGLVEDYFGADVVVSLVGLCRPYRPASAQECAQDGWRRFVPAFADEAACRASRQAGDRRG